MAKYIELFHDEIDVVCPRCESNTTVDSPTIAITADGIDCMTDTKLSRNRVQCKECKHEFSVYLHCDADVRED